MNWRELYAEADRMSRRSHELKEKAQEQYKKELGYQNAVAALIEAAQILNEPIKKDRS